MWDGGLVTLVWSCRQPERYALKQINIAVRTIKNGISIHPLVPCSVKPSFQCPFLAAFHDLSFSVFRRELMKLRHTVLAMLVAFTAMGVHAADYPAPQSGTFVVKDFQFKSGEKLPAVKLHPYHMGT